MNPIQNEHGFWHYATLPPGWRPATPADFRDLPALISIAAPYLLHCSSGKYYCRRIRPGFALDKIEPWLSNARIFILSPP